MFAVVAVNTNVHGGGTPYTPDESGARYPGPVFHYHVPETLAAQVQPGMLVEVPFGSHQVQALVLSYAEAAPVPETKPVTRLLYAEPVLDSNQIELGLCLSQTYLTPLIECFRLMLPPGLLRQPRAILRLHPEASIPDNLPPAQRQVVAMLQSDQALSVTQIARRVGRDRATRAIRSLVRQGLLIRASDLPAPRAQPKRVNFVRLVASPPQVDGVRPLLGHSSKQADVLRVLLDDPDPLPTREHVLAQAEATASTLHTISGKGWIEITPEQTLILLRPEAASAQLQRAPAQAAVLAYLQTQGMPLLESVLREATGTSSATIKALEEKSLVERIHEPATVHLRLAESKAREQISVLRGATRQHQVLDYLLTRKPGEWVWISWIYAETDAQLSDLRALESHHLVELAEHEVWRDPLAGRTFALEKPPRLTPDQERAWEAIRPALTASVSPNQETISPAFLLHGVTGSGKTEIYMRAVQATLAAGRQAIVLVPEIALTPQTIARFSARFPDRLGILHSELSDGERYDTWRRIRAGELDLIVGPRSALFAPLLDVGLIVLDEEHESSYKQDDIMPTYHARDVAAQLATIHHATLLLGSATPDLVTAYRAYQTSSIQLLELPQRLLSHRHNLESQQVQLALPEAHYRPLGPGYEDVYVADLPPVRVVDMRHELRVGNRSMFSRVLQSEIERALTSREQVILFLNRRGASTFVMCRDCGNVIRCPRCDIPLTFHRTSERMSCHHCNYQQHVPEVCPLCQSTRIRHFGVGTERVETAIHEQFPSARTMRWDRDTTREKGSHDALLEQFTNHQADIMIGTQMIAKGLDLPLVTLVGVIAADTALNLPDYRASERTFQLLAQVAGRAGRGPRGGRVIIQTYTPDHYAIRAAAKHDYAAFYQQEQAFRHRLGYPPFGRLARLLYSDRDNRRAKSEADQLAQQLSSRIAADPSCCTSLLGPAPAFLSRLRGRWRWQIILRATDINGLQRLLSPVVLSSGWRLDIDPVNLL